MSAPAPPVLSYDPDTDVLTFDGIQFSGELMRQLTASPCGVSFRIVTREDGAISVSTETHPLAVHAPAMLAALRQIVGGTLDDAPPFRAMPASEMQRIARATIACAEARPAKQPLGEMLANRETLQTLLDLLNPLHGKLDQQTYDAKVAANFDALADTEYSVTIAAKDERDLTQAVCILESRLRDRGDAKAGGSA